MKNIKKFLKMKTEASGFPSHVVTDEHKRAFVANYELHEGIKLNIDNIKPNTGMKAISKLFLNSLWGRFGLNSNKTQQKLISEISDLYELFLDDQYLATMNFNSGSFTSHLRHDFLRWSLPNCYRGYLHRPSHY